VRVVAERALASGYGVRDMLHPLGDLPPSVYWRRRLALLASVIALIALLVLTVRVLTSNGSSPSASGAVTTTAPATHPRTHPRPSSHSSSAGPSRSAKQSSSAGSSGATGSTRPSGGSGSVTSSAPPSKCTASQLSLSAASNQPSYAVGDQPVLSIVVKNTSTDACVQDLADPQVVLRVYNGESRVWGSHDCKIEPGTNDQTLMPGRAVRVSIVWSGLSSQPNNCDNRQRAGAGTYTLYASLSGREGAAAQFIIR
jgi:hypothetical protein